LAHPSSPIGSALTTPPHLSEHIPALISARQSQLHHLDRAQMVAARDGNLLGFAAMP